MTKPEKGQAAPPAIEIARHAAEAMLSRKAEDVLILDLRSLSSATDFFVIGSGETDVQVRAIADAVVDGLEGRGVRISHVEGYQERRWVLLDCIDVVIHVFLGDIREFYGLERLWGDAAIEKVED
ncbi:MAG: ribosome silencing factor [Candidatus Eisenbacteria bacterium]